MLATTSGALAGKPAASLPAIGELPGAPSFTVERSGYTPSSTDRTIPYWTSSFTDPSNGVTYPFAMVGNADPRTNHGGGTTTVPTEIVPLALHFAAHDYTLDGTSRVAATVGSPVFQAADYSVIASNNHGVQLEDATMRSQFNEVGSSPYHLLLGPPTILPTVTIDVPKNQGLVGVNARGVVVGRMDVAWFSSRLHQLLGQLGIDPTTLPVFLTDNVFLYDANDPNNCCILGYHGAHSPTGGGADSTKSNGNAKVQTFIYTAYITPGTFRPTAPMLKDIHALSHEVAEWGDDPFTNNLVNPWLTPTAPQYGCTNILETGDPVVGIGFNLPGNTFDTCAYADGTWHPEDEVFLPWFARQSPNTTSESGRYTLMGSLNPYPGFQTVATGC